MSKSELVDDLVRAFPLISDQIEVRELKVILRELQLSLSDNYSSSVVEMGCYVGTTSLFIQRMLDSVAPQTSFHVYDSFAGLPSKTAEDASPAGEQFVEGELSVSKKQFELQFKKAGLRLPRVHKKWFSELSSGDIPDDIAYAYLDGDYYESIKQSLQLVWPKLTSKSRVVVDDYANEALPGTRKAVDEWLLTHPATIRHEATLAVIYPQ